MPKLKYSNEIFWVVLKHCVVGYTAKLWSMILNNLWRGRRRQRKSWSYRVRTKNDGKCLCFAGYRCHVCAKPMHKECIALMAKCGSPSLPELPPRPSLHQRMSSISLMETNNNAATSTATTASIVAANADYVNTNIEEHSWWDNFLFLGNFH